MERGPKCGSFSQDAEDEDEDEDDDEDDDDRGGF